MYSRNTDDTEPTSFGVSGKLWNGVLVMYDRGSESLWTQIDGRALEGPRQGEYLEHVPSTYTSWEAWVAAHPDTLVLDKPEEIHGWEHSRYDEYLRDPDELFMPELAEGLGGVGPKDVIFGVGVGGAHAAVTEELLLDRGVVNGVVGHTPVAWVRLATTGRVIVVDRRGRDGVLLLEAAGDDGRLRDVLSDLQLRVEQLLPLRVDRAFWYAWKHTHPDSTALSR